MPRTEKPTRRIHSLDGVRAFAILGVLCFHAGVPGLRNGAAGVIVFFVLSGYLITTLLVAAPLDRRALGLFYLRRVIRLFPALAVLLLVCAGIAFTVTDGTARRALLEEIVFSGTYLQDLVLSTRETVTDWGYLGHTWSLAVEEQFYLLWPLILVLLAALSASRRALLWTTLTLTVLSVAWRSYLSWEGLANRVGVGLDGNAESLLVGCSLALLLAGLRPSLRATRLWSLAAAVALAVLAVLYTGVVVLPLDMTRLLTAVTAAVVVAGSVLAPTGRTARVLGWAPLAYIGLVSYGLYLWHPVVFRLFEEHVELATLRDKVIWAPAMLGLTALVTIASYHWVEKPFNRLKDSLPGARSLPRQPEHSMSGPGASSVPATPNRGSQAGDEAPTPAQ